MPINEHWSGVLNQHRLEDVAAVIRQIFEGKTFAIANAVAYNKRISLMLYTDCGFNTQDYGVTVSKDGMTIGTSGFYETFAAAPGAALDHEDFKYAVVQFERNAVTLTQRASDDSIQKACFCIQASAPTYNHSIVEQLYDIQTAVNSISAPTRIGLEAVKIAPEAAAAFKEKAVRVWSEEWKSYWRPKAEGYTPDATQAGQWSFEEAFSLTQHCGPEKQIKFEIITTIYPEGKEQ